MLPQIRDILNITIRRFVAYNLQTLLMFLLQVYCRKFKNMAPTT